MKLRIHREHWIFTIVVLLVWSVLMRLVFIIDMNNKRQQAKELLEYQGRMLASNIMMTWLWNTSFDGVYVYENNDIKPNMFLDESDRVLVTDNGDSLIRVSHGMMGRHIGDISNSSPFIQVSVPSTTPLNPHEPLSEWDKLALERFKQGELEIIDTPQSVENNDDLRYMLPLYAQSSCLSCHDQQGYQEGSLMGGLKITLLSQPFQEWYQSEAIHLIQLLIGVWLIGCVGIIVTMSSISRRLHAQAKFNKFEGVLEMAGTAAHELNQPLQIISGYAELITMLDCSDHDTIREMLGEIRNNVIRLSTITRKLNNITRYETIELSDSGRIVDLNRAADDTETGVIPGTPVDTH